MIKRIISTCLLACLAAACSITPEAPVMSEPNEKKNALPASEAAPSAEAADFFPVKAELRHAKAFNVVYHRNYKVVTILQPWRDAGTTYTYVLVQRGTTPPPDIEDAQVIEIPVERLASLATTHLPYLDELSALDTLAAVGNAEYVNTPGVVERIRRGKIKAVGNGPEVNIETLLEVNPEMITTLALGNPRKDDEQQLRQKGFKVVVVSDFMEETPLGRAEWVKFFALFFNREAQAERVFSGIEERYEKMQALAANVTERPTVIMGFEINGQWNMPGGRSYQAAYIRDAGGDYLWGDDDSTGRIPLSFEAVLHKGANADFWFNQSVTWRTAEDVLAADVRYERFRSFAEGQAYNNNARLNATGGNDYNESGHANPDVILADLISILHPQIIPDHDLIYYTPLRAGSK